MFLGSSVAYYKLDCSPFSDPFFDKACKDALAGWPKIKHPHKRFIKVDMLTAGTGYNLDYRKLPSMAWLLGWTMKEAVEEL